MPFSWQHAYGTFSNTLGDKTHGEKYEFTTKISLYELQENMTTHKMLLEELNKYGCSSRQMSQKSIPEININ